MGSRSGRPGSPPAVRSLPRRAVQSTNQEVHAGEGEQRQQEADHGDPSGPRAAPAAHQPHMQIEHVDEPCDQHERLLRIPSPVAAPGVLGPDGAEEEAAKGEEGKADGDRLVDQPVEARQPNLKRRRPGASGVEQVEKAGDEGDGEEALAYEDKADVEGQPMTSKGGHQRHDLGAAQGRTGQHHECGRQRSREEADRISHPLASSVAPSISDGAHALGSCGSHSFALSEMHLACSLTAYCEDAG